jgi:acyl dehydratase
MSAAVLLRALLKRPQGEGGDLRTVFMADPVDMRHLVRYRSAFGFGSVGIPLTYHYLAVQRAHLVTMLRSEFPFRIAGMVHVANGLEELAPLRVDVPYELRTHVRLEAATDWGARYCECMTEAVQGGLTAFRCNSRYLAVRGKVRPAGAPAVPMAPAGDPAGAWQLAGDDGRRYAALSGDWNPIHLWFWSARLMGLEEPIIHGMHTLAKSCSALEQASGRRIRKLQGRFRSPVPLGASLAISADAKSGIFSVASAGKTALEGSFEVEQSTS